MINEVFKRILEEYQGAKKRPFKRDSLAHFIRHDVPKLIAQECPIDDRLIWTASAGQGRWADAPWIAVFDPLVTDSPQRGYYPVYLFSNDLKVVFLSMNQGMSKLRDDYGDRQAKIVLNQRARILKAKLKKEIPSFFNTNQIDLASRGQGTRLSFYEAGHSFGRKYLHSRLPSTDELIRDLSIMIDLYRAAIERGGTLDLSDDIDSHDESRSREPAATMEEKLHYVYHRTIERNPKLAKEAKKIHGYVCQVCEFDFGLVYGELGEQYIEAHHLTPLSKLQASSVQLSPKDDFSVVCANCHRMIHRKGAPVSFEEFARLYSGRNT